ncbi:MAG TPA: hypothetical protein VME43_31495 [Bryobacteraceae bacterium]|nr:hypothetical protein [Bryobacteraceae bacterium]
MKTLTMRSMIVVAALAVAAGSASAQTYRAEIPMAFRAGNKVMEAGAYDFIVKLQGGGQEILLVSSLATNRMALLMPTQGDDAPNAWKKAGAAVVTFECLGRVCTLRQLWDGNKPYTYAFPSHKLPASEANRSVVNVPLTKGD